MRTSSSKAEARLSKLRSGSCSVLVGCLLDPRALTQSDSKACAVGDAGKWLDSLMTSRLAAGCLPNRRACPRTVVAGFVVVENHQPARLSRCYKCHRLYGGRRVLSSRGPAAERGGTEGSASEREKAEGRPYPSALQVVITRRTRTTRPRPGERRGRRIP